MLAGRVKWCDSLGGITLVGHKGFLPLTRHCNSHPEGWETHSSLHWTPLTATINWNWTAIVILRVSSCWGALCRLVWGSCTPKEAAAANSKQQPVPTPLPNNMILGIVLLSSSSLKRGRGQGHHAWACNVPVWDPLPQPTKTQLHLWKLSAYWFCTTMEFFSPLW